MPIHLLPPFVAALLLLEPLLERLHQLVPAAERLDLRLFLLGEVAIDQLAQPLGRDLLAESRERLLDALEVRRECAIEAIEVFLVLHHRRAGEVVEVVDAVTGDARFERLQQRQVLGQRYGDARFAQREEEARQHACAAFSVCCAVASGRDCLAGTP